MDWKSKWKKNFTSNWLGWCCIEKSSISFKLCALNSVQSAPQAISPQRSELEHRSFHVSGICYAYSTALAQVKICITARKRMAYNATTGITIPKKQMNCLKIWICGDDWEEANQLISKWNKSDENLTLWNSQKWLQKTLKNKNK